MRAPVCLWRQEQDSTLSEQRLDGFCPRFRLLRASQGTTPDVELTMTQKAPGSELMGLLPSAESSSA